MKTLFRTLSALVVVAGLTLLLVPIAPASGDDCTSSCSTKRTTCDGSCNAKKGVCIVQCGLPMMPGYDKCTQKCNSDQGDCSLQCQAEQKVCEVRCKVGQ